MRRILCLGLTFALFAGCSQAPVKTTSETDIVSLGPLENIDQLINQNQFDAAQARLNAIRPASLSPVQKIRFHYLSAQLAIALGRGDKALDALNAIAPGDFAQLTDIDPASPSLMRAQALALKGEYLASARERIFLSGALSGAAYDANHEAIWQTLLRADTTQIEHMLRNEQSTNYYAWLQLALIMKQNQLDMDKQLAALRVWKERFATHPAAVKLPGSLDKLEIYVREQPKNIALLLPLTGKLASTGIAVRDGFLAAYYQSQKNGAQLPVIQIIDTNSGEFLSLYDSAVANGAELIIGPIQKNLVEQLQAKAQLPVPTLALNYGQRDRSENPSGLVQFGLAAEDEAAQVATYARQLGYKRATALVPDGNWGDRVYEQFASSWQNLGGDVLTRKTFSGKGDYNSAISSMLNVDKSEARKSRLERQLNIKLEGLPRRRGDVDFIFVASLPDQARQIKPTLAYNYADDVPVLATSQLYEGIPQPDSDRDLNAMIFCDMPWVFSNPELRQQIHNQWPQNKLKFDRLYALGVDAYRLYPRINQLTMVQDSQLNGFTGVLTIDAYRQVVRHLGFAKFIDGTPRFIPGSLYVDTQAQPAQ